MFAGKAEAYQCGAPCGKVGLALPANIWLGWKQIAVANTLAYYDTATITTVKSFPADGPRWIKKVILIDQFQLTRMLLPFNEQL